MRLLAPSLAVLFVAGLIGCGGGGGAPSFDDDPDTGSTSGDPSGGNNGTGDGRAPAGPYTATFAGSDGTASFTGTGSGTVAADGTIALSLTAANTSNATARAVDALVAPSGSVTGTVTVGADPAATIIAGSLASRTNGSYLLTATFTTAAGATETDRYTLTARTVTYTGPNTGTDNQGFRYSGSGTGTVSSGNVLSLTYLSRRSDGSEQTHRLSTTLLAGGTFSGSLNLGLSGGVPVTGSWANGTDANGAATLTLTLSYTNNTLTGVKGNPKVSERLVLTAP